MVGVWGELAVSCAVTNIYSIGITLLQSIVRIVALLVIAVFIAEIARMKLGDDKLRRLLAGVSPTAGRLRGAALGAVLPFCECGAFPVMLGLIRAGVPLGAILTFFMVSPVMSVPALLILLGLFGPAFAAAYFVVTVGLAVIVAVVLEAFGSKWGVFKPGFVPEGGCCESAASCDGSSCGGQAQQPGNWRELTIMAGRSAWSTVRKVLPYAVVAILLATAMKMMVSPAVLDSLPAIAGRYGVLIGAVAGIPLYAGDCTMIALVAPFLAATGLIGPMMAFMIAGSATSINGLVFMSSVFQRRFLLAYVVGVLIIAVVAGYVLSALPLASFIV